MKTLSYFANGMTFHESHLKLAKMDVPTTIVSQDTTIAKLLSTLIGSTNYELYTKCIVRSIRFIAKKIVILIMIFD